MFRNRITELLGIEIPIIQAPMGYIARSPLASAVSNAGGMGIIETSSGELDAIREEIRRMRALTDKPFGVNIAQNLVRDPSIVDFVVDNEVRFVTTSAGDPNRFTRHLKDAGLTVFHVVPSLRAALKAVDAGVDGLVVEGSEGGGFKNPKDVSTMVLLPLVASQVDVPIVAAGGFLDGRTMAAAFTLGAEGVQMGTRMVATVESPIHENWKLAIVAAPETGTVLLNRHTAPAIRVLRTEIAESYEFATGRNAMEAMVRHQDLYFGGDLAAGLPFAGQVAGRIDAIRPVAEVLAECARECLEVIHDLAHRYPNGVNYLSTS
jgi:enoyl-[acyl-carrier protein] reductase II